MSENQSSASVVIDTVPFGMVTDEWKDAPPAYATIREIDFELTRPTQQNGLRLFFSKYHNDYALSAGGIQELINEIIEGDFKFENPNEPTPVEPYLSPLSLSNSKLRYIVYVLANKNWQFSRLGRPMTAGNKKPDEIKGVYFDARRAWSTGKSGSDQGTDFGADISKAQDGSRVLYFIADGRKAIDNDPGKKKYVHPINLHLDLILPGSRYIPIIVDPDIRFPGGSLS